jgi:hypothetical protein
VHCRWSKCSWFSNPQPLQLQASSEAAANNHPSCKAARVGGAAAQNRFSGRTAVPIGTCAPKDGSPLQQPHFQTFSASTAPGPNAFSQTYEKNAVGGAVAHSRFNDRKHPCGQTCDGSAPSAIRLQASSWVFNWECGAWEREAAPGASALSSRENSSHGHGCCVEGQNLSGCSPMSARQACRSAQQVISSRRCGGHSPFDSSQAHFYIVPNSC